jgi:hypothetical protein
MNQEFKMQSLGALEDAHNPLLEADTRLLYKLYLVKAIVMALLYIAECINHASRNK